EIVNLKSPIREDGDLMHSVFQRIASGTDINSKDVRVLREFDEDARADAIANGHVPLVQIAERHGIADPVRARRSVTVKSGATLSTALNDISKVVGSFTVHQITSANQAEKRAAK